MSNGYDRDACPTLPEHDSSGREKKE